MSYTPSQGKRKGKALARQGDFINQLSFPDWNPTNYQSSQRTNISGSSMDIVPANNTNPDYSANAVDVSLQADHNAGDPLVTEFSTDTWPGTVFICIGHILGGVKWRYYRDLAKHILRDSHDFDHGAAGSILKFLVQNPRIGYLHSDLAHLAGVLPVFEQVPKDDREVGTYLRASPWIGIEILRLRME